MWGKNAELIAIIPARYNSVRLPAKPLLTIGKKPLLQLVYESVHAINLFDRIIIATDHPAIVQLGTGIGAETMLTSTAHQSGTDRCAEAAFDLPDDAVIVNIQGDEIVKNWDGMSDLLRMMEEDYFDICTLASPIVQTEELHSPNSVKVVFDKLGKAMYFSRSPIPFVRDIPEEDWVGAAGFYRHIGVYSYRNKILQDLAGLEPSSLEKTEKLEQLRWLEHGYEVGVVESAMWESFGVDTGMDLNKVRQMFDNN